MNSENCKLFRLISNLNYKEKKYLGFFFSESSDNYSKLYKLLNNPKASYSKIAIKLGYKNESDKSFIVLKNYLYQLILNNLITFQNQNVEFIEINNGISKSKILIEKGLYKDGLKILEKYKTQCLKLGLGLFLPLIETLTYTCYRNIYGEKEAINSLVNKHRYIQELLELSKMKIISMGTNNKVRLVNQNLPFLQNSKTNTLYEFKNNYYPYSTLYDAQLIHLFGTNANALTPELKIFYVDLSQNFVNSIKTKPIEYLYENYASLFNGLISAVNSSIISNNLKFYAISMSILDEFIKKVYNNTKSRTHIFQLYYTLLSTKGALIFNEPLNNISSIKSFLLDESLDSYSGTKSLCLVYLGIYYYKQKEHKDSISFLTKSINSEIAINKNVDLVGICRIFILMNYIDMGEWDYSVELFWQQSTRFFKLLKSPILPNIFDFISSIILTKPIKNKSEKLNKLIQETENNYLSFYFIRAFNLKDWIVYHTEKS